MVYDPRMVGRGGYIPAAPAPAFAPDDSSPSTLQPQQRQGVQFAPVPPPQQPKQWWEGAGSLMPKPKKPGEKDDDKPPNLLDMMMGLGKMSRPEYDKAIQGSSPGMAMASPWAWLGSLGMPGGAGWGGGKS